MNSIQQITMILKIVAVVLMVVLAIVGIYVFYITKVRKPKGMQNTDVDYSELQRRDSLEYIKFDDIQDDMIITHGGTVFHGAIQCQGFDYFTASSVERQAAHSGYLSFVNIFPDEMVYRQYTKSMDMSDTLKRYQDAYDSVETELFCASRDFDNLQADYIRERDAGGEAGMNTDREFAYLSELDRLNTLMDSLDWQRHHIGDNIAYINEVSSMTAPERVETYLFKWEYTPGFGKELTEEQIYKKAKAELANMASAYMHALSNAGVNSVRMNTAQLRQMYRRHWHPTTANIYKDVEVDNSSFYIDVVRGSAMTDADYEVAEQQGVLGEVYDAQERLVAEGKSPESLTLNELLAYGRGEAPQEERRLTADEIRELQIANRFKEREMARLKEEEDRKKKESRKSYHGPVSGDYASGDIDFGGLGNIDFTGKGGDN